MRPGGLHISRENRERTEYSRERLEYCAKKDCSRATRVEYSGEEDSTSGRNRVQKGIMESREQKGRMENKVRHCGRQMKT